MFIRILSFGLLSAVLTVGAALSATGQAGGVPALDFGHLGDAHALGAIAFGGLIINRATLTGLFTGFNAAFQRGLTKAPPQWQEVAMKVSSATSENDYGWLGEFPGFREWVGDRVVHGIEAHGYTIKNKSFESTIGVKRDKIEDDQYGVYGPIFEQMGRNTAAHPNKLVFDLLRQGFSTPCYDGQYFFDTDHQVLDEAGTPTSVANTDGGSGTPWFLMDLSQALKPVIFQERRPYDFTRMDAPTDEVVFQRAEYRYGVDARVNVGFGLWQVAWGSRQTLDQTRYAAAREALLSMKADYGDPLGLMPTHLVVPPSLEGAALKILNAENDAAGATNVYRNTAKLVVVPWLA